MPARHQSIRALGNFASFAFFAAKPHWNWSLELAAFCAAAGFRSARVRRKNIALTGTQSCKTAYHILTFCTTPNLHVLTF
jgi:hypothetical protein